MSVNVVAAQYFALIAQTAIGDQLSVAPDCYEPRSHAAAAFLSLPALEQTVLWHVWVNAVPIRSAALFAGVTEQVAHAAAESAAHRCRSAWVRARLEAPVECGYALVRLELALGEANLAGLSIDFAFREHLATCRPCTDAYRGFSHLPDAITDQLGVLSLSNTRM